MTTLVSAISKGKRIGTIVKSFKLLTDATIEYYEKGDIHLTFCKGTDPETKLIDSVLLRATPEFTNAPFVSLVNLVISDKGERANQAVKLSKSDFQALLIDQTPESDII